MLRHDEYLYPALPPSREQIFGIPGASLVNSNESVEVITEGTAAQIAVGEILDELTDNHSAVYVFHSLKFREVKDEIDHIVVYGKKVFIIESKNWAGNHTYATSPTGKTFLQDEWAFDGNESSIHYRVYEAKKKFGSTYDVQGVVCVAAENVELQNNTDHFDFVSLAELKTYFEDFLKKAGEQSQIAPSRLQVFAKFVLNPLMHNELEGNSDIYLLRYRREITPEEGDEMERERAEATVQTAPVNNDEVIDMAEAFLIDQATARASQNATSPQATSKSKSIFSKGWFRKD